MIQKSKRAYYVVGGIIVVAFALMWYGGHQAVRAPSVITNPDDLPGMQIGNAPWAAELGRLRERLNAIGLPALTAEGTTLHIHQHLDIFVHGKIVPVPAGVGVNGAGGFISPVHTHDDTGVIHVESPTAETFTLGQFFDVWGVRFTPQCIGGYCATGDDTLAVFVDGAAYAGDPRALELQSRQEIVIAYGTKKELPNPLPSAYSFPAGE